MSEKRDLLAIGHTALDYIIQVNEFPLPNSSTTINNMRTFQGGAAANVAVVASSLGLESSLVSAVGGDFLGSEYQNHLENLNINIEDMIIVDEDKTPTAFVLTDSNHDQIFYFYWGAATRFKEAPVPADAISNVQAVHLATGDPTFNSKCGEFARKEGKIISFDPGQDLHMYSSPDLLNVLKICDILFGNHHEIGRILESINMDIDQLREYGPSIVVETRGRNGSVIYADEKINIDAVERYPTDPTGAGDSYRAGFLKSYLEGESLEYCGKLASAVSSFIVEAEGCQTNVPTPDMAIGRMLTI
ncbi:MULTISPECIES: carbohydrate kinase family protein [Methanobacterium]|uniref:Carbohydrate kinase family protein n=1 Tax=Methanobacterium subterraneum TaxID=59277 RepID=A0A2H4VSE7_9EURY|nr:MULTISPECIES: carbohydrate kinase family protein [Methanobacterium]MBW4256489.1 carbohydrate kinase family protein [Methanobacterium sp. YSL]PKL72981.1 MAG: sugar kinase [Methanobacteriales archaeon HGW-Methanobacteriales-2]AUB57899.1 sugar kinase [Methanobacterium sp. MZ-A1]AUB61035.1 sugar kinase [Methanobacterium subterraneum]NMO10470.1 carbohydrate kinase family protein [Methanobacterium subterraneum]